MGGGDGNSSGSQGEGGGSDSPSTSGLNKEQIGKIVLGLGGIWGNIGDILQGSGIFFTSMRYPNIRVSYMFKFLYLDVFFLSLYLLTIFTYPYMGFKCKKIFFYCIDVDVLWLFIYLLITRFLEEYGGIL